jgi:hypothetical protein
VILRWLTGNLLPIALVGALAALGTAGYAVNRWIAAGQEAAVEADRAARRIADLEAEIEARRMAAEVHRAHAERLARESAARATLIEQLQNMEGLDAPLPNPLADAAGLLWQ